ncbi:hypothetical protein ACTXT7_013097 [Hymenolepis weldensis]
MGITLETTSGVEWKLSHIEYSDDLYLISNAITEVEGPLERLDTVLTIFRTAMATDEAQMCLGEEPERNILNFEIKSIERVNTYRYLDSPINTLGDTTEAISGGIANGRRQLKNIGPIVRSWVLAVRTKASLVEIFVSPATYYEPSNIVLRVKGNCRISALLNTARRVILALNFRRLLKVEELAMKVPLKCTAAIIQAHMKFWNRQLQVDVKELFSEDVKSWLTSLCSKIPENEQHRPNLVGSRPLTTKCSNLNCSRWFAGRAEMLRQVPKRASGIMNLKNTTDQLLGVEYPPEG